MNNYIGHLRNNLILVLSGLMISFSGGVLAQQLSPEQMKKDIFELRKALEKNHPGIYWYTSKEQFNLIWDSLTNSVDKPMTDKEFFKLLLPVVADSVSTAFT